MIMIILPIALITIAILQITITIAMMTILLDDSDAKLIVLTMIITPGARRPGTILGATYYTPQSKR